MLTRMMWWANRKGKKEALHVATGSALCLSFAFLIQACLGIWGLWVLLVVLDIQLLWEKLEAEGEKMEGVKYKEGSRGFNGECKEDWPHWWRTYVDQE